MELRHVRYFEALAETLNFTRAAEHLHVTQSTLSHQIRQLEEEIGQTLFDRSTKKVRITEAGEILLSHLTPALAQIDRGLQAMRGDAQAMTSQIRLGSTSSFNTRMVPQCISTLLKYDSGVQVTVEELSASQIAKRLLSGHLDLGVSYRQENRPELWFEPLYSEELQLVVGANHPMNQRRWVRMVELHQLRMVLLPPEFQTRKVLEGCFETAGCRPNVVAEFNSIAATIELIRQTDLAGIIAMTALTKSSDLFAVPLQDPRPMRTLGLLWKKGGNRSSTQKQFTEIIRRAAVT
jgi:LysR family transcriptional regulator, cyn operon transcriptional activator